jgi:threonylcarbamoyladenosine tRNA methylthiotransferase MtaB
MSAPKVITLGCRLNAYESDIIQGHARDAQLTDCVIINTCAVTGEAVRQSRQTIRRAHKDNPDAQIIVTGCAAQIDPGAFADMPEVSRVIGNQEKMLAGTFEPESLADAPKILVNDIMAAWQTAPQLISGGNRLAVKSQDRTRAFLQVQNGCDHRCTFCIIPYGRGPARSVPAGEVVAHVRDLAAQGFGEVVLTGVDLSSWGGDLPGRPPLGDLVRRVLKLVPELPRLRLSSIDPAEVDAALFEALTTEPRMTPYLHLSLQAGDDMILKRMKRRHLRAEVGALCKRLKSARPEITFGADMIAGFPTETDEMFENGKTIISEIGIPWLHVFPYSPRGGTPAANMPPVNGKIIKARAKALRNEGARMRSLHLASRIGQIDIALFEEDGTGRCPDFTRVKVDKPPKAGQFAKVKLAAHDGEIAIGQLI